MTIQTLLASFLSFINTKLIPLLLAVAVLVFLWNVVRFFIIGGAQEESREKAKSLAIWGILGFVVILSLWGFVNIVMTLFGVGGIKSITPDYLCKKVGGECIERQDVETPPSQTNQIPGVTPGFNIPGNETEPCLPPLVLTNGVCSNAPTTCSFPYYIKDGVCTGP